MSTAIRLSGHTMGTPELGLAAAIRLFQELNLDGIEVIVDEGYQCGLSPRATAAQVRRVRRWAADAGLTIVGLVPYTHDLNAADGRVRNDAIEHLRRVIEIAHGLGCPGVRILAGRASARERPRAGDLVAALLAVADEARAAAVGLNIENHPGTLAESVRNTVALLEILADPVFGIILDPVNLILGEDPSMSHAYVLQAPYVRHVHAKDYVVRDGAPRAAPIGEGVVPWETITSALLAGGYSGFVSLEYERRWQPDHLPEARVGMASSRDRLRVLFDGGPSGSIPARR